MSTSWSTTSINYTLSEMQLLVSIPVDESTKFVPKYISDLGPRAIKLFEWFCWMVKRSHIQVDSSIYNENHSCLQTNEDDIIVFLEPHTVVLRQDVWARCFWIESQIHSPHRLFLFSNYLVYLKFIIESEQSNFTCLINIYKFPKVHMWLRNKSGIVQNTQVIYRRNFETES